jgi:alcohol dehydrogenase class IV
MVPTTDWSYPTPIRFGPGRIAELTEVCARLGLTRPMMVTDAGLADLPHTKRAFAMLEDVGRFSGLFADVPFNPTGENLIAGIKAYRDGGHDGVVAYGGGSALDLGKLIAFMAQQTRPVWDFEHTPNRRVQANDAAIDPVIAVPTTAGSGSEVGQTALLINTETGRKTIIFHPRMLPDTVIADPDLTVGVPFELTAGTGMEALTNGLEAFCALGYHPMSEGIALNCVRLVRENLPLVLKDPEDLTARAHMLSASMMGAVALQRGFGAVHALSHAISALYGTQNGMTNAVLLPYVIAANRPGIDKRMRHLAGFLNLKGDFYGVLKWLVELRQEAGVPHALPGLRVDNRRFDAIAEMAMLDPSTRGNPVTFTPEGALAILNAAYAGELPV